MTGASATTTTTTPGYNFASEKFWQAVVLHRQRNGQLRGARCFRYNDLLKKLGLQILASTGSSFYKFIHRNLLEGALPSLTTIKSFCSTFVDFPVVELGFLHRRLDALGHWLHRIKHTLPFLVGCDDAVAVLPRVRCRYLDDAVFGAAIPDDELPYQDMRTGDSVDKLLAMLEKYGLATQALVMLVGPANPAAPRFVLAVFAQKSGGTAALMQQRWLIVEDELRRRGMYLICSGVDGGGANVSAQLQYQKVRDTDKKLLHIEGFPKMPSKGSKPLSCALAVPADVFSYGQYRLLLPVRRCVQDPVHLTKKLVNPLCNEKKDLQIGGVRISTAPLLELLSDHKFAIAFEERLKLRLLDLKRPDRQDFRAAQRLLDPNISVYLCELYADKRLSAVNGAELLALIAYLKFARAAMDSYLNPKIEPCARIEAAAYAHFFAKAWNEHLQKEFGKASAAAPHFISSNAATGLRMNAEFLFVWTYVLAALPDDLRKQIPYAPWLFGSQPCEELFRLLRQMPGYENFDIYELLKRLTMLQATVLLKAEGIFRYPESKKAWNFDELCKKASPLPSTVVPAHLHAAAARGCRSAIEDVAALCGVKLEQDTTQAPCEQLSPAPEGIDDHELCSDDDEEDSNAGVSLIAEPIDWTSIRRLVINEAKIARRDCHKDMQPKISEEDSEEDSNSASENECEEPQSQRHPITSSLPVVAQRPAFSPRQDLPKRCPSASKMTISTGDGQTAQVSKTKACWIISGHPRSSKDRLVRVRGQGNRE